MLGRHCSILKDQIYFECGSTFEISRWVLRIGRYGKQTLGSNLMSSHLKIIKLERLIKRKHLYSSGCGDPQGISYPES